MGKRLNVFISEKAYELIKEFQRTNMISNLDNALDEYILKNGDKK